MPIPAPLLRRTIRAWPSQALLHFRGRDASLTAISGQPLALTRSGTRTATDTTGATVAAVHSMPAWSVSAALFDGNKYAGLTVGASDALLTTTVSAPAAMSGVVDLVQSAAAVSLDYFLSISNAAASGAYFYIGGTSGVYVAGYYDGATEVTSLIGRAAGENGKRVRLRFVWSATGTVQIWRTIDGGAESTDAVSGTLARAAWPTGAVWRINQLGSSANGVAGLLLSVKVVPGEQTLATIDATI